MMEAAFTMAWMNPFGGRGVYVYVILKLLEKEVYSLMLFSCLKGGSLFLFLIHCF